MLVVTYKVNAEKDKFNYTTFFCDEEAISYAQCAAYSVDRTIALLKCLELNNKKGEENENDKNRV